MFFKDTTDHHCPRAPADAAFLRGTVHTFLIRDPREAVPSHYALNPKVTLEEIGYAHLDELYRAVEAATGGEPTVIDAHDLVHRPDALVRAWCERVGLPFRPESLHWSPGDRDEWSATARWHTDVSRSHGFHTAVRAYPTTVDNDPVLAAYHAHHEPYYRRLWERRLPI
ncbi:hypothetical protein AB0L33_32790 [Streptomyces sp. NPDC052299]|uniref:sulfotransferase-like domain-containing protein n=1 Tax=Streptomyces sp. NPDC052299 TaxID=3155054 RepID=UPI003413F77A